TREGEIREAGFAGLRQSLDLETEQLETADQRLSVVFGLRMSFYGKEFATDDQAGPIRDDQSRLFRYGERLRFRAKLRPPRNYRNPGAFDSVSFLHENGTFAL